MFADYAIAPAADASTIAPAADGAALKAVKRAKMRLRKNALLAMMRARRLSHPRAPRQSGTFAAFHADAAAQRRKQTCRAVLRKMSSDASAMPLCRVASLYRC